eukprot:7875310-Alexandrium_andersonii.AAC.1
MKSTRSRLSRLAGSRMPGPQLQQDVLAAGRLVGVVDRTDGGAVGSAGLLHASVHGIDNRPDAIPHANETRLNIVLDEAGALP